MVKARNCGVVGGIVVLGFLFAVGNVNGENVVVADEKEISAAERYSYDIAFVNPADNLPDRMTNTTLDTAVTLPKTIPVMSGYAFGGWCDVSVLPGEECAGMTYTMGANYTLDVMANNDVTLYAIWKEVPDLFKITAMQQMTSEVCANTTTPLTSATALDTDGSRAGNTSYVPSKTLIDLRDNKTYVVRKLADGNCWMVQNLYLNLDAEQSLSSDDTDLQTMETWTPDTSTSTTVPQNLTTGSTSYTRGNKWCSGTTSNTDQTCNATDTGDQTNHVGNLYNWYAATAGTGTGSMASASATNTSDATDSICPKGWQLPAGGKSNKVNTNNNMYSLYNLMTTVYGAASSTAGSVTARSAPMSFIFSGRYADGSLAAEGSGGYYWSSSASTNSTNAYNFGLSKTSVNPTSGGNKGSGRSIRCVAR